MTRDPEHSFKKEQAISRINSTFSLQLCSSQQNKPHLHPSYSLHSQYQLLLTSYFMHTHKASWVKQATSVSIAFIANIISTSTYTLFHAYTHKEVKSTKPYLHPP